MSRTEIEWTDYSWNPIRARNLATGKVGWHCEHVTTGCENCYAETMNRRLGTGLPFKPGHRKDIEIFLDEKMLVAPLAWRKPRMIFCCSMTDLFAEFVPDEWIGEMIEVMRRAQKHTFQVLTKRPLRMRDYFSAKSGDPPPNIWLGVSAERQEEADERIPLLLQTPAAVRFLSAEPLLGPLKLTWIPHKYGHGTVLEEGEIHGGTGQCVGLRPALNWVIVGGESGARARPMQPDWARSLRDQCKAAGVPFFYKQTGEWIGRRISRGALTSGVASNQRVVSDGCEAPLLLTRVGKKYAGRQLDGLEHNAMPNQTTERT